MGTGASPGGSCKTDADAIQSLLDDFSCVDLVTQNRSKGP